MGQNCIGCAPLKEETLDHKELEASIIYNLKKMERRTLGYGLPV